MRRISLLCCFVLGFSFVTKAQIYSSEALFYVKAGTSLLNDPNMEVVTVDNETNTVFIYTVSHGMGYIEKNGFQKFDDPDHVRDNKRIGVSVYQGVYNSRLSKNGKEVYEYYAYGYLNRYFVFSSDKSTYEEISSDGTRKTTYVRVTRDKFKTKSSSDSYDFLYD